ncbi:MAG: helix-turn-helix domain-containing protein [Methylovulum sp.]|jgi:excisionase family DNA binding protein|nr:helix-turn-helix domain-containing protein [Methylovulum sp.]
MSSKPIINSKEAAQLLQMSPAYVCTLALEGDIPAFKLGDDWRFVTDQLISYMADKASQQQRQRELEKQQKRESEKQNKNKSTQNKRGRPKNEPIDFSKYA